jgi:hypothetical protein
MFWVPPSGGQSIFYARQAMIDELEENLSNSTCRFKIGQLELAGKSASGLS